MNVFVKCVGLLCSGADSPPWQGYSELSPRCQASVSQARPHYCHSHKSSFNSRSLFSVPRINNWLPPSWKARNNWQSWPHQSGAHAVVRADPFVKPCVLAGHSLQNDSPSTLTLKSSHIVLSFRVPNAIKDNQNVPEHASPTLLKSDL